MKQNAVARGDVRKAPRVAVKAAETVGASFAPPLCRPGLASQHDNLTLLMRTVPRDTRELVLRATGDQLYARRLSRQVASALQQGTTSSDWGSLAAHFALDPGVLFELRPPLDGWCLAAMNAMPATGLEHPSQLLSERAAVAAAAAYLSGE